MKRINVFSWRPVYIAYLLSFVSVLLLFFIGKYEADFGKIMRASGVADVIVGLSLHKIVLFLLDLGMMVIIIVPLKNEDERIEKIRNYTLKTTFRLTLLMAICIGVLMDISFGLLIYIAIVEAYYLLLFELCILRDSSIVYMTDEQLVIFDRVTMKHFKLFTYIQVGLMGVTIEILFWKYHRPDLLWLVVLVNVGILVLVKTVYFCWKN